MKRDLWIALTNLNDRLSRVEKVRLFANDVVQKLTQHFSQLRLLMASSSTTSIDDVNADSSVNYSIHSFLKDDASENALLSKIADLLVIFLLPKTYTTCVATRAILCQVVAKKIFRPAIEYLTSPSAINQWLLILLQSDEDLNTNDVDQKNALESKMRMSLKQQRLNILADIVQATRQLDSIDGGASLEEQMRDQIAQLVRAKADCEEKLVALGKSHPGEIKLDQQSHDNFNTIFQCKSLSFATIMNSGPFTRRYFYQFLEQLEQQDLLGFWAAVEELKVAEKTLWHQLSTELFYTYINQPFSKVLTRRVDRSYLKRIEDHLLGDLGPDVFYELQEQVLQDLESKYYPAFLISDTCYKMLEEAHENNICLDIQEKEELPKNASSQGADDSREKIVEFGSAASLDHIKEKLQNKSQALRALQGSLKSDSKVLRMLQEQVESLKKNKDEVELHLQRTSLWTEFLGQWRCHVQTVEYIEGEETSSTMRATLIVHVAQDHSSPSWICTKNVQDFHLLHKELLSYFSWLKGWLPSSLGSSNSGLINFATKPSSNFEKTRNVLQRYMDAVLSDERLNQSETLFHFLSPSPAFLKSSPPVLDDDDNEEVKFIAFPKIFKNQRAKERRLLFLDSSLKRTRLSEEDHDVLAALDSRDGTDNGNSTSTSSSDGVAEPFYALISEVFDMRGVSKILRKSLMTFVQLTYGRTITSYITSYISWMTSDRMVIKYIKTIKNALWPSNTTDHSQSIINTLEKEIAREKAKERLINHIPDWLSQLVGQQCSKVGVAKVFDTLQEKTLNKMLIYDLVEILMYHLFPEVLLSEVTTSHSKG